MYMSTIVLTIESHEGTFCYFIFHFHVVSTLHLSRLVMVFDLHHGCFRRYTNLEKKPDVKMK